MRDVSVMFEDEQRVYVEPAIKSDMISCISCILEQEGKEQQPFAVDVTFVDNVEIRRINGRTRHKKAVTDVLSFPMFEKEQIEQQSFTAEDYDPETNAIVLGNIVISVERAQDQAEEYGHSLRRELCFLTVHSMLHLLGYDHENSRREEDMMIVKQTAVLERLHITRED